MIFPFAILAAVVACISIENSLMSNNLLTSESVSAQYESSNHQTPAPRKHWFFDAPLGGRAPDDCDFTGMLVTNPEHMRLVEAHPQYIACLLKHAKENAGPKEQGRAQKLSELSTEKAFSLNDNTNQLEEVNSND